MNAQRRRKLFFSGAGLALMLAGAVALNVVAHFLYARLDLSAGRAYSISSGTKAVLSRLSDNLVIRAYFTPHLPPPYGVTEQYLRDLLGEYRAAGRGKVQIEFIDPDAGEQKKREAQEAGVPPLQMNVVTRDKFEAKQAYMGVVFLYKGKKEVLPVIQDEEGLEFALTRHIKKLSDPALKTVGFVAGHEEKGPDEQSMGRLFGLVREQMNVETVKLDKPLPPRLDALWILGPSGKFKPAELEALKAWVDSGKSLGLFVGRRAVLFQRFQTAPLQTGLEELLGGWGLEEREGLVVDAQCERIQMQSRVGPYTAVIPVEYPYLPIVKNLSQENPATRALNGVTFPFAHPLAFRPTAGVGYASLADSSRLSWYQTAASVSPDKPIEELESAEKGPFSLAGVLSVGKGKVIVVGSRSMIDLQLVSKPANVAFFLNLLDWSFQDQDLLSIRAKGVSFRPLRPLPDGARLAIKYWMILFLPAALLAAGGIVYRRLQARRERLRRIYAPADA